jgi:ribonuclease D
MTFITRTEELEKALKSMREIDSFVTIDTEFLREDTYWPQLCLVQVAGSQTTILVDTLSPDLSLDPLFDFMKNDCILKVFHAARQDLEIFYHLMNEVPQMIFDTQIAAMVCGYGEQVGYETLVSSITGKKLDKSQQYSNWTRRPLSEQQLTYARADVIYLRDIYLHLSEKLAAKQRQTWIEDEMAILKSEKTYKPDPESMWTRLRLKNAQPHYLARLQTLASLREKEAIRKNIPRGRLIRDDVLTEIAYHNPSTLKQLTDMRGAGRSLTQEKLGQKILENIIKANTLPVGECPQLDIAQRGKKPALGQVDLLRVLLKIRAEKYKVAEKLIATTKDLESFLLLKEIDSLHSLLHGWRYDVFGQDAWEIKEGRKGLSIAGKNLTLCSL